MLIALASVLAVFGGIAALLGHSEAFQPCVMVATMMFALSAALDANKARP